MSRIGTLLLFACLLAAAERPSGSGPWAASFAKEAAGDYPGALAALQPLRGGRNDPYLLALRGAWLQYRAGRFDDAVAGYLEACRLAPAAIEPRLGMITPLIAAKRWPEAERQARQVLRGDPGCFWASYWLVEILLGEERWRDANEVSRSLVERYPGDSTVLEQAVRSGKLVSDPNVPETSARLAILKLTAAR